MPVSDTLKKALQSGAANTVSLTVAPRLGRTMANLTARMIPFLLKTKPELVEPLMRLIAGSQKPVDFVLGMKQAYLPEFEKHANKFGSVGKAMVAFMVNFAEDMSPFFFEQLKTYADAGDLDGFHGAITSHIDGVEDNTFGAEDAEWLVLFDDLGEGFLHRTRSCSSFTRQVERLGKVLNRDLVFINLPKAGAAGRGTTTSLKSEGPPDEPKVIETTLEIALKDPTLHPCPVCANRLLWGMLGGVGGASAITAKTSHGSVDVDDLAKALKVAGMVHRQKKGEGFGSRTMDQWQQSVRVCKDPNLIKVAGKLLNEDGELEDEDGEAAEMWLTMIGGHADMLTSGLERFENLIKDSGRTVQELVVEWGPAVVAWLQDPEEVEAWPKVARLINSVKRSGWMALVAFILILACALLSDFSVRASIRVIGMFVGFGFTVPFLVRLGLFAVAWKAASDTFLSVPGQAIRSVLKQFGWDEGTEEFWRVYDRGNTLIKIPGYLTIFVAFYTGLSIATIELEMGTEAHMPFVAVRLGIVVMFLLITAGTIWWLMKGRVSPALAESAERRDRRTGTWIDVPGSKGWIAIILLPFLLPIAVVAVVNGYVLPAQIFTRDTVMVQDGSWLSGTAYIMPGGRETMTPEDLLGAYASKAEVCKTHHRLHLPEGAEPGNIDDWQFQLLWNGLLRATTVGHVTVDNKEVGSRELHPKPDGKVVLPDGTKTRVDDIFGSYKDAGGVERSCWEKNMMTSPHTVKVDPAPQCRDRIVRDAEGHFEVFVGASGTAYVRPLKKK